LSEDAPLAISIRDLIDQRAEEQPDRIFITDPISQSHCSYSQLRRLCQKLCDHIKAGGVVAGESVAYAMHNGIEAVIAILGLQYGGYRAVSINLVAGCDVIGYVLAHSETVLVLTQDDVVEEVNKALLCDGYLHQKGNLSSPSIATLRLSTKSAKHGFSFHWDNIESSNEKTIMKFDDFSTYGANDHKVLVDQDGLLMYTSGTTGRPKGVVLSQRNILAGGHNVAKAHALSSRDKALCVLPLFHINGLCVTLIAPLVSCGSVVMPPRFSTSKFWCWIEDYSCTWFSVVPTQISYLLRDADTESGREKNLSSVRFGRSASAPLSPDVHESFEAHFCVPLIETMGLTETAAQILSNPLPPGKRKLGSPGVPVGVELRIVNSQMIDVATDTEGELLIRGACVMQRYFRNPEATVDNVTADGWLRTGDLGRVDKDGYVFITGRLKELIIKGGENIAPREIDDALYRHPDVVEAAAFAVHCHDYGQRVEAAVSLKPGSTVAVSDLLVLVEGVVGEFKCPDQIHLLKELPKGPSGKIQRNKLSNMSL